jgi:hypothetical protein
VKESTIGTGLAIELVGAGVDHVHVFVCASLHGCAAYVLGKQRDPRFVQRDPRIRREMIHAIRDLDRVAGLRQLHGAVDRGERLIACRAFLTVFL